MSRAELDKANETLADLMRTLHDVVADSGHAEVAARLPWRALWSGSETTETEDAPTDLPDALADRCIQAFSLAFQLADHAEEHAVAQELLRVEDRGTMSERSGSFEKALTALQALGLSEGEVARALGNVHIEPVLTAHPTEAKRQTVLEHQRRLYQCIVELENPICSKGERAALMEALRAEVERLWRTGEIYLEKPELADERRMIVHYLARIFPQALVRLERRLHTAWRSAGFDPAVLKDPSARPKLTLGNWVGGDRDGHPLVTPEFTRETLSLFRETALGLLDQQLSDLAQRLSFSENRVPAPPELRARIEAWAQALGDAGTEAIARNRDEAWRQYVNLMRAALPTSEQRGPGQFSGPGELATALDSLETWLEGAQSARLAAYDVAPIRAFLSSFGFHLAAIDIRQNSAVHDQAIGELLAASGHDGGDRYAEWSPRERRALLERELTSRRPLARLRDLPDGPARETLTLLRMLEEYRAMYGSAGLGGLIVSMTRSAEDLLALYVLGRDSGLLAYDREGGGILPLPVVPLFETIDDLARAPQILDAYLAHPIVRRSLAAQAAERGDSAPRQQVMVGYSDSGKDGGIVASMWSVHRAQQELIEVAQRHGVELFFFHGRGGTIGRGAGPTHRFVGALPARSVGPMLRVTEQGETIRQKFANPSTAAHQLELYAASALERHGRDPRGAAPAAELPALMDRLRERSLVRYRELIEHPDFVAFFERVTPIDAIEQSRIGSRPARRPGARQLGNLRAIPWVFSWNQARFVLPGWFGLGAALRELREEDEGRFDRLREAKSERARWAPIHYLVSNAATALATASPSLMTAYAELANEIEGTSALLWMIHEEYEQTKAALEAIYGAPLEQARPRIHRAIALRSEALLPIHRRQIELLRRWRGLEGDDAAAMVPQLLRTINAISSGLGATG